MRLILALVLLTVAAYCIFAFAATFEPMDPAQQWLWRAVYVVIGFGCLGIIGWNARPRK
jgi:hypothetical protein